MKKLMIAAIIIIVAAGIGFTVYEATGASSKATTTTSEALNKKETSSKADSKATKENTDVKATKEESSKNNNEKVAATNSNTNANATSETTSKDVSATGNNTDNNSTVTNTKGNNTTDNNNTTKDNNETNSNNTTNTTNSNNTVSNTIKNSAVKSTTDNSSEQANTNTEKGAQSSDTTNSTASNNSGDMIDGQPVLSNQNAQVASYFGTWTIGKEIGKGNGGENEQFTVPTGENIILTKSLFSFDGTVIQNPNYYIISVSASDYFGSEGWSGDIGTTSNGVMKFIIAAPSNEQVTADTVYRYERQLKILINGNDLAVFGGGTGGETVYSASL